MKIRMKIRLVSAFVAWVFAFTTTFLSFPAYAFEDGSAAREIVETAGQTRQLWRPILIQGRQTLQDPATQEMLTTSPSWVAYAQNAAGQFQPVGRILRNVGACGTGIGSGLSLGAAAAGVSLGTVLAAGYVVLLGGVAIIGIAGWDDEVAQWISEKTGWDLTDAEVFPSSNVCLIPGPYYNPGVAYADATSVYTEPSTVIWTGTHPPSEWNLEELEEGIAGTTDDPDFARRLYEWVQKRFRRIRSVQVAPRFVALDDAAGSSRSPRGVSADRKKRDKNPEALDDEEIEQLLSVDPDQVTRVLLSELPPALFEEELLVMDGGDLFPAEDLNDAQNGLVHDITALISSGQWVKAAELIEGLGELGKDPDEDALDGVSTDELGLMDVDPETDFDEGKDTDISPEEAAEMVVAMLPEPLRLAFAEILEQMSVVSDFRSFPDQMRRDVFKRVMDSFVFAGLDPENFIDFWNNLIAWSGGTYGDSSRVMLRRVQELAQALLREESQQSMLGLLLTMAITLEFVDSWERYRSSADKESGEDFETIAALIITAVYDLFPDQKNVLDALVSTHENKKRSDLEIISEEMARVIQAHATEVIEGTNGLPKEIAYAREAIIEKLAKLSGLPKTKTTRIYDRVLEDVLHFDRDPLGFHHSLPTRTDLKD